MFFFIMLQLGGKTFFSDFYYSDYSQVKDFLVYANGIAKVVVLGMEAHTYL